MVIRNDHACHFFIRICQYGNHFRRAQRILDQKRRVLIPIDDIDLLSAQFIDNGIDTRAVQPDTCAHRIYVRIIGPDCHLRTRSCFAGNTLDLYGSVFYFRNLRLKQAFHQFRMGTGYEDLRSFRCIFHFHYIQFDTVSRFEHLAFHLFVFCQHRIGSSEIDTDVLSDITLYHTGHDIFFFFKILIEDRFSFFLADLLQDQVLCILRCDPSE